MRVRLLGPVDVIEADVPRRVAGLRPRAVLAVLALSAGEVVGTGRLLDVVWDGCPGTCWISARRRATSGSPRG